MSSYSLDILINGKPVTKYPHKGSVYVEGRTKSDYHIRFRNHTDEKVMAIISVDGLSVIDGEEATYKSGGYVVEPRDEVVVKGWRISDSEVAKFTFSNKNKSFAAKSGNPENTGVVGVAVFKEVGRLLSFGGGYTYFYTDTVKPVEYPHLRWYYDGTTTSNSVIVGDTVVNSCNVESEGYLGTEFGRWERDEIVEVEFNKQNLPVEVLEIYYDTREGLIQRGVKLTRTRKIARAFPKETKYCTPPNGWTH